MASDAFADLVRAAVLEALAEARDLTPPRPVNDEPASWRERLWTTHAETRMDVDELAEALGRPRSAIYKLTSAEAIPHAKDLSGCLVFRAGEIRAWIRANEKDVVAGESWTPSDQRPRLAS
jgi:predicted DNA-binding transcriptional regulator AlpA